MYSTAARQREKNTHTQIWLTFELFDVKFDYEPSSIWAIGIFVVGHEHKHLKWTTK